MGLLDRINASDTLSEFDDAARDRYWDALTCAVDGRYFAACYLWGYTIEMVLKTAYFRVIGVDDSEDLRPELQNARAMARARGVRNLHDLLFWSESLIATRRQRGVPMSPALAVALSARVSQAAEHWREVMRYRRAILASDESHEMLRVAEWVLSNDTQLWS